MLRMFDLNFNTLTLEKASQEIVSFALAGDKGIVVTPNVDHIMMLEYDHEMRTIYKHARFVFADGMPIVLLSKILASGNGGLPERVTGADMLPQVCSIASRHDLGIYFLGGEPGIAEKAARNLTKIYPGLKIVGIYSPPFGFELDPDESKRIVERINSCGTDILFIGVGAPKQEKWAWANMDQLQVGPILCVGAAFDFMAGDIKRAPRVMQKIGLEWFWRLINEPGRLWKRYLLRDSRFIFLAFREIYRKIRQQLTTVIRLSQD
jgi:N-acetylglucosaminyldiphosphoundecaprenol N-acetyl-beta-D-mannosaminyltransferase